MQRIYCHNCTAGFAVPAEGWDGTCPRCHEGFVEVLGPEAHPPPGHQPSLGRQPGGYQSSFQLPGGMGTVRVVMGSGNDLSALGGPFGPGFGPGLHGGYMGPGPDPFELIRALMGGAPFGNQELLFGGDYNQEEMDRVITQIMNQYQPQTRETARRVRDHLPRLRVRPKEGSGSQAAAAAGSDSEMGMAAVSEGEPCSVCHDDFKRSEEVVELPCNHCFHEGCLMPWLEAHNTCPVCRLELPVEGQQQGRQQEQRQGQRQQSSSRSSAAASRAASRRQESQPPAPEGGGFVGSLNQLLHSIADRWEASHGEQPEDSEVETEAEAGRADSRRGSTASPLRAPSSRAPSSSAPPTAPPQRTAPESPRTSAGRAAAARAAGLGGTSSERRQGGTPSSAERSAGAGWGAGAPRHPQRQQHEEEEEEEEWEGGREERGEEGQNSNMGMALGGALAALAGAALSAFMGRNRGPQQ
ncbi:hypothetical protein N2152v2_001756 [Parachlorella kessleri]